MDNTWAQAGVMAGRFFRRGFSKNYELTPKSMSRAKAFETAMRCIEAPIDRLSKRIHFEKQTRMYFVMSPFRSVSSRAWALVGKDETDAERG